MTTNQIRTFSMDQAAKEMDLQRQVIRRLKGRRELHLIMFLPWKISSNQVSETASNGSKASSVMFVMAICKLIIKAYKSFWLSLSLSLSFSSGLIAFLCIQKSERKNFLSCGKSEIKFSASSKLIGGVLAFG